MERERILTDEEWVSRILGLPRERIDFLKENHGMVCDEEGFSDWFVENSALVLEELKNFGPIAQWKASVGARTSETEPLPGVSVPDAYDS